MKRDAAFFLFSAMLAWAAGRTPDNVNSDAGQPEKNAPAASAREHILTAPLSFEPSQGQAGSGAEFLSRGSGYTLGLAPGEVVLNLERRPSAPSEAGGQPPAAAQVDSVRMSLIGANAKSKGVGLDPQPGVVNYLIGNDPRKWRTGIPTYGKVAYAQVYPGVDLVFYGNQRQLEYDFVIAPGADPGLIAWRIDGARASVNAEGDLVLKTANGPAGFKRPAIYQMEGARKAPIEGAFAADGDQVRFKLGSYDRSKPLIVDPTLSYSTYLAGSWTDYIGRATGPGNLQVGMSQGIAIDASGSAYVTGYTASVDFPTTGAGYQSAHPAKDGGAKYSSVFVTKFNPDGRSLAYSTYLGGSGSDYAHAIAVDSGGNAYVTGYTSSNNFPITAGAYQTLCSPTPSNYAPAAACNSSNASAFVTKLNATGTGLVYSTFLGGYGWAYGTAIAVDAAGRAYIAGNEEEYCSTNYAFQGCFPTAGGPVIPGSATGGRSPQYAFAAVFDSAGSRLLYSTLFGDLNGVAATSTTTSGATSATGIQVDSNGYFYLIGETMAGKLPTTPGVIQPAGMPLDGTGSYTMSYRGFIAKFNPVASGASLAYCTYLGGRTSNTSDYLSGIAIDSASNAYVVGYTNSTDFPVTPGVYQTVCAPGGGTCAAAHVTKLNPTASSILWSTYVGGGKHDGSDSVFFTGPIQLDGYGNVYFIATANPGFPFVNPVETASIGGPGDVVVVELDPTGSRQLFSSEVGSGGRDPAGPGGLAVDLLGNIYVAGNIVGSDLITTSGAFETRNPAPTCCYHGYVAKIATGAAPVATLAASSASVAAGASGASVSVDADAGSAWIAISAASWITITSGASGIGNGTVAFSIAANSGDARSGAIVIGGRQFTVYQQGASSAGLSIAGSMAQIASAGGWDTSLTLVNLSASPRQARLNFYSDDGSMPLLPFTFPQQPAMGTTLGATFERTLAAGASFLLDTTGPASEAGVTGLAQLLTNGDVGGFAIFTYTPNGQAAVVPLETRNAPSYLLAFDNTGAVSTGLAVANLSAASAANVNVVIRSDSGTQIGTGTIHLAAGGHASFMLTDPTYGFPATASIRGTVEFDTPAGGRISMVGLRANAFPNNSGFAVTSLPALANVGSGGGAMAHIASGLGWQTTFTLVNTGTATAAANLNFYDGNGMALTLPLSFPQTGDVGTASSVSRNIPPGGTLVVAVQDQGNAVAAVAATGSAVLTTSGKVGGFAIFRYNPTGQEAVVPLQAASAPAYVLAFDNTGALSTGLAISNFAAQAANVSVVIRDDAGVQIGTETINLAPHGHTSFMLTDRSSGGWPVTAGVRGTLEFDTPSGGNIAPLGLRAAAISGGFTVTTIPVMEP